MHQDEHSLENIVFFINLFNKDELDISVVPAGGDGSMAYRAVVNRKWMRVSPEFLSSLYGGYVASNLVVVGQPAFLPGDPLPASDPAVAAEEGQAVSMRDPLRAVFRSGRTFERMFIQSNARTEVVLSPIAIYREREIPAIEVSEKAKTSE
jgi:hypothetical protein